MEFCDSCGQLRSGAKFCARCGIPYPLSSSRLSCCPEAWELAHGCTRTTGLTHPARTARPATSRRRILAPNQVVRSWLAHRRAALRQAVPVQPALRLAAFAGRGRDRARRGRSGGTADRGVPWPVFRRVQPAYIALESPREQPTPAQFQKRVRVDARLGRDSAGYIRRCEWQLCGPGDIHQHAGPRTNTTGTTCTQWGYFLLSRTKRYQLPDRQAAFYLPPGVRAVPSEEGSTQ